MKTMKTILAMMILGLAIAGQVSAKTTKLKNDPTAKAVVARYQIENENINNLEYRCLTPEDLSFTLALHTESLGYPAIFLKNDLDPEVAKITKKHGNSYMEERIPGSSKIMVVANVYYEPLNTFTTWVWVSE